MIKLDRDKVNNTIDIDIRGRSEKVESGRKKEKWLTVKKSRALIP